MRNGKIVIIFLFHLMETVKEKRKGNMRTEDGKRVINIPFFYLWQL